MAVQCGLVGRRPQSSAATPSALPDLPQLAKATHLVAVQSKEGGLELGTSKLLPARSRLLHRHHRQICVFPATSAPAHTKTKLSRVLTDPNILVRPRLVPLLQVSPLPTAQIQHLDSRHASVPFPPTKLGNQDRLDPVVKVLEADDGRVSTCLPTDVGPCVVCVGESAPEPSSTTPPELTVICHSPHVLVGPLALVLSTVRRRRRQGSLRIVVAVARSCGG